jgi:hypothetical protein
VPSEPTARGPRLPNPDELARRLEEGRNSAKVLSDVITDTPPAKLLEDDLVTEFVERCQRASRSIQGYMDCRDPVPDHETMETLIDTNEQLQNALNLHRRATLSARKNMDLTAPLDTSRMSPDERGPARRASPPAAGLGIHHPVLDRGKTGRMEKAKGVSTSRLRMPVHPRARLERTHLKPTRTHSRTQTKLQGLGRPGVLPTVTILRSLGWHLNLTTLASIVRPAT